MNAPALSGNAVSSYFRDINEQERHAGSISSKQTFEDNIVKKLHDPDKHGYWVQWDFYGTKRMLLEHSWTVLMLILLSIVLACSLLFGALLWSAGDTTDYNVAVMRAFFLMHLELIWEPTNWVEQCVAPLIGFIGSMITLCFFGLVFVKFSQPHSSLEFSGHIMLRKLPQCYGGWPAIIMRCTNRQDLPLKDLKLTMFAVKDVVFPGGDHLTINEPLPPCSFQQYCIMGAYTDIYHVIDPASSLYREGDPGYDFSDVIRIVTAVSGSAINRKGKPTGDNMVDAHSNPSPNPNPNSHPNPDPTATFTRQQCR